MKRNVLLLCTMILCMSGNAQSFLNQLGNAIKNSNQVSRTAPQRSGNSYITQRERMTQKQNSAGETTIKSRSSVQSDQKIEMGDTIENNGIFYRCVDNNKLQVVQGANPYKGAIEIPLLVKIRNVEYKVVSIGKNAFADSEIISIKLPESIMSIEEGAFRDCSQFSSINIPNNPKLKIKPGAFWGCDKITSPIISNDTLYYVNNSMLSDSVYTIPENVKVIGKNAFACSVKHVNIPNSVEMILSEAFFGCPLDSVYIPGSVKEIGEGAFERCESLKEVHLSSGLERIRQCAFIRCYSLATITIPSSVAFIENGVFQECYELKKVILNKGLVNIGRGVFYKCYNLESVIIPEGVTVIDKRAFQYCKKLQNVKLPSTLAYIGDDAFHGCSSLTEITLPSGIEEFGRSVFSYCENLKDVYIKPGLKIIGEEAFYRCGLTSVTIPKSVEDIGRYAFGCRSLSRINLYSQCATEDKNSSFPGRVELHVLRGTKHLYENKAWKKATIIDDLTLSTSKPKTSSPTARKSQPNVIRKSTPTKK